MADRPEMFAPTWGFSGIADSMEPCKMFWGRPLLLDLVAYLYLHAKYWYWYLKVKVKAKDTC